MCYIIEITRNFKCSAPLFADGRTGEKELPTNSDQLEFNSCCLPFLHAMGAIRDRSVIPPRQALLIMPVKLGVI